MYPASSCCEMGLASSANNDDAVWGDALGGINAMYCTVWDALDPCRRPLPWPEWLGRGRDGDGDGVAYVFLEFFPPAPTGIEDTVDWMGFGFGLGGGDGASSSGIRKQQR